MNKNIKVLLLLLVLLFSGVLMGFANPYIGNQNDRVSDIAHEIIRFHVIANSDSEKDQELKLKVKDGLVKEMAPYLSNASSITDARDILYTNLNIVEELAQDIINQNGYDYPVKVNLGPKHFPIKVYGDYTFPSGVYEALSISIGQGKGKNWWCVMFPPLCFVDETYCIVNEEAEEQLKYLLTEEELDLLKSNKDNIKIKFKLWEEFKELFDL
ncbi:MAG: stage II sporulation protein R [Clostridiales bacterium]|nr:stage II sporulation protein R [Clostridiales bacterium]